MCVGVSGCRKLIVRQPAFVCIGSNAIFFLYFVHNFNHLQAKKEYETESKWKRRPDVPTTYNSILANAEMTAEKSARKMHRRILTTLREKSKPRSPLTRWESSKHKKGGISKINYVLQLLRRIRFAAREENANKLSRVFSLSLSPERICIQRAGLPAE